MLGSPPDINGQLVIEAVRGVESVHDIHHVHLWQMQENMAALDCHVVITEAGWQRLESIKTEIKAQLKTRFNIVHSSLEFEHIDHAHQDANLYGHE